MPIVIIHVYMLTHEEDIGIIHVMQQTIEQTLIAYSTHFTILIRDFKKTYLSLDVKTNTLNSTLNLNHPMRTKNDKLLHPTSNSHQSLTH